MINNAKRWATARGQTRTNEVHGLEEYKIPIHESFLFKNTEKQSVKQNGSFEVQDMVLFRVELMCIVRLAAGLDIS